MTHESSQSESKIDLTLTRTRPDQDHGRLQPWDFKPSGVVPSSSSSLPRQRQSAECGGDVWRESNHSCAPSPITMNSHGPSFFFSLQFKHEKPGFSFKCNGQTRLLRYDGLRQVMTSWSPAHGGRRPETFYDCVSTKNAPLSLTQARVPLGAFFSGPEKRDLRSISLSSQQNSATKP